MAGINSLYAFAGVAGLMLKQGVSTRYTPIPGIPGPDMNQIPVSQLPLAAPLQGDEMVPMVQNGQSVRAPATAIGSTGFPAAVNVNRVISLYYVASAAQEIFSLATPDRFGNTAELAVGMTVDATAGGIRLALDDGTGYGGYTVTIVEDVVTLLSPAGAGEQIIIDVYENLAEQGIEMDGLTISTQNVIPPLSKAPNGELLILFVNGYPFFPVGSLPSFTYTGTTLTWISLTANVPVGASVFAVYSYG